MYFDSKIKGKRGLPWFDSRTEREKRSDAYFEKLEEIAERIDDVESNTTFITDLDTDDFDSGWKYCMARIRELRKELKDNHYIDPGDWEGDMEELDDIRDDLEDLETDAILYDGFLDDDDLDDDDLDDFDDDDEEGFLDDDDIDDDESLF